MQYICVYILVIFLVVESYEYFPILPHRSHPNNPRFSKDKAHDVSVHCPACVGRGLRRHRSTGVIPHIQIKTCTKCKGRGKIWVARGSELHLKGQQVVYSQDWKGDTFGTNINRQVPSHRK